VNQAYSFATLSRTGCPVVRSNRTSCARSRCEVLQGVRLLSGTGEEKQGAYNHDESAGELLLRLYYVLGVKRAASSRLMLHSSIRVNKRLL
jgi:hypothetical protein